MSEQSNITRSSEEQFKHAPDTIIGPDTLVYLDNGMLYITQMDGKCVVALTTGEASALRTYINEVLP